MYHPRYKCPACGRKYDSPIATCVLRTARLRADDARDPREAQEVKCIVGCGREATEPHHWPGAVGMGRNRKKHPALPTVPICRTCHDLYGGGNEAVTLALIANAPAYWQAQGTWEVARPYLERFVGRREYLVCVR